MDGADQRQGQVNTLRNTVNGQRQVYTLYMDGVDHRQVQVNTLRDTVNTQRQVYIL